MSLPIIPDINKYSDMDICNAVKLLVIALTDEEKAITQLLDAEKNKILYAIEKNADCCDLLKINESVNDTIKDIAKLEMLLEFKLEKTIKIMEECTKCEKQGCSPTAQNGYSCFNRCFD